MATVFRVQNKDGRGPYRSMLDDKWYDTGHHNRCRTPWDEKFFFKNFHECPTHIRKVLFAFPTLAQLKWWFTPGELKSLRKFGFHIYKISGVEISEISLHQCTYIPHAKQVTELIVL